MGRQRRVVFLVHEHAVALDFVGPAEVFAAANRIGHTEYAIEFLSRDGGSVATASGLKVETRSVDDMRLGPRDTLIVAGGLRAREAAQDRVIIRWIRDVAKHAHRICSVCSGAFFLAQAGLLDGRRAVTHWNDVEALRSHYPDVQVELDPIYVNDGPIWTSAGITAGIDLALALVSADHGRSVGLSVAKTLVMFLHRPGGQAQFSRALANQAKAGTRPPDLRLDELHAWMQDHLDENLGVGRLAALCHMAPRTFARRFGQRFGATPAKLVQSLRVEAARGLLEEGLQVKAAETACGFGDEGRMRRAFVQHLGLSPAEYRARFGPHAELSVAAAAHHPQTLRVLPV